ncbi:MAG: twin-arginine translocation signal domain-containing protein [Gemmatimonadales bacterium]
MTQPKPSPSRRDFVSTLALGGISLGLGAGSTGGERTVEAALVPDQEPVQLPPARDDGPWDMSWLDRVSEAEHKLVFDIGAYQEGGGLYYAKNYLNGMRDGWGIEAPRVLPILGVSGSAYPIVFGDDIWARYEYGASSKSNDPRTGKPAVRNIFWQPKPGEPMAEFGVDVLQARGCQLLFCNNVFRGVIRGVMAKTKRPYAEVRAELNAGFLPGVIVVPAMVAAMSLAQARGAGYVFAGA